MHEQEKRICDKVLNAGAVTRSKSFIPNNGVEIQQFMVEYKGEQYDLTRHDGEWVYFHHMEG